MDLTLGIRHRMVSDANIIISVDKIQDCVEEIISDSRILEDHPRKLDKYVERDPDAKTLLDIAWDLGFKGYATIPNAGSTTPMSMNPNKRFKLNHALACALEMMLVYAMDGSYIITEWDASDPTSRSSNRVRVENGRIIVEESKIEWFPIEQKGMTICRVR